MKKWISNNKLYLIGATIGAIIGWMYWSEVGCSSGTCAITSKPINSTLYGAMMGALLLGMFKKEKKEISFGTILLNEQKFIGANLCQHYDLCDEWIIVEGACKGYPERKVSKSGTSLDCTEKIIKLFPDPEGKITFIQ